MHTRYPWVATRFWLVATTLLEPAAALAQSRNDVVVPETPQAPLPAAEDKWAVLDAPAGDNLWMDDHEALPWETGAATDDKGGIELQWSGSVLTEVHYRTAEMVMGAHYDRRVLPQQFSRNENSLNLRLRAGSDSIHGVADLDFDWMGFAENLSDLTHLGAPEIVSPYRLQAHELYVQGTDLFVSGLDLRLGQQTVAWGVGDQFNPTNNLNSSDLENVLLFGRQVANLMARVDYAITDIWSVSAVAVPIFKPALLPATGPLALTAVDRLPFLSEDLRWRLHSERELGRRVSTSNPGDDYPTVVTKITPVLPESTPENAQWALRIVGTMANQDVALSYYRGRTDFPVAVQNRVSQTNRAVCDPEFPEQCTLGFLETEVTLRYPKMQVVGLNLAGEVNPFGWLADVFEPIGYRLEVGLYIPSERRFTIMQDNIELLGVTYDGEYDYDYDGVAGGARPLVVDSTPFAKWVLGLDYSFGRYVYANVMWVHGMVDEFGAGDFLSGDNDGGGWSVREGSVEGSAGSCVLEGSGEKCATETLRRRLGDYLVVGVDVSLLDKKALVRLFTIWDLGGIYFEEWNKDQNKRVRTHKAFYTDEGLSAVIYPEVQYDFGQGFRLSLGAFLQLGKDYTKFGEAAAGGSSVWTRGTFAF